MSTSFYENTLSSKTSVSMTREKINFIWTIKNFLFLSEKSHLKDELVNSDECVVSAEFNSEHLKEFFLCFKLLLWPCIVSLETEIVGISIVGVPGADRAKLNASKSECFFSLVDSTGKKVPFVTVRNLLDSIPDEPTCDCWLEFMRRDYLLEKQKTLLPDGILKIKCEIDLIRNFSVTTSKAISGCTPTVLSTRTLHGDLENLLKDGTNWDFELICGDAKFRVHKAIFSARSQVFCEMFESDTTESEINVVTLSDIEEPVMMKLLKYIYGVEIEIPKTLCMSLYLAAGKYGLMELRLRCSSMLKASLSASNIWDVAIAADALNDQELFASAKTFLKANADSLLSKNLIEFAIKSPEVANRLMD